MSPITCERVQKDQRTVEEPGRDQPAHLPDEVRVDGDGESESAENSHLGRLGISLDDRLPAEPWEIGVERAQHRQDEKRMLPPGGEGRGGEVREDEQLDVVGKGDSPEAHEGEEKGGVKDFSGAGSEPGDHGGGVEGVGNETREGLGEREDVASLGGEGAVDVLSRSDNVEDETDRREDEEALVERQILNGQGGRDGRLQAGKSEDSLVPVRWSCECRRSQLAVGDATHSTHRQIRS